MEGREVVRTEVEVAVTAEGRRGQMAAATAMAAKAGWPVDGMDPIDGRGAPPPAGKDYN